MRFLQRPKAARRSGAEKSESNIVSSLSPEDQTNRQVTMIVAWFL